MKKKMLKAGGQEKIKVIKYVEVDGLLYLDLILPVQKEFHLSRFGRMKKAYMQEHHTIQFTNLLVSGELHDYLQRFDNEVNDVYDRLIEQYKIKWNVTKELKEKDQMRWVQEMNSIEESVMEFIKGNYIYN